MARRTDDFDLSAAIADSSYTPGKRDLAGLVALLGGADEEARDRAERAIVRMGSSIVGELVATLAASTRPLKARVAKVIGRVAEEGQGELTVPALLALLRDEDAHAERAAIQALGRSRPSAHREEIEAKLVARLGEALRPETTRAIVAALGKLGGQASLAAIAALDASTDAQLAREVEEARIKLDRTTLRETRAVEAMTIDASRSPRAPLSVNVECRAGLAELVAGELSASLKPRVISSTIVAATLTTRLDVMFGSRVMLGMTFPLDVAPGAAEDDRAIVDAVTGPTARAILETFTRGEGRIPYRLEWRGRGHQRARTFKLAAAIDRAWPRLINDPTASLWEVTIDDTGPRVRVALRPRGLDDPRFQYRVADVPASSHPTIAAALVRVAGARDEDIVWDPFVGSGTELIERARMGPFRALVGTDLRDDALESARANARKEGLDRIVLTKADARVFTMPDAPTLIVTNPPMGRRILDDAQAGSLLTRSLTHFARTLAPRGRIVWASPKPDQTRAVAKAEGLVCTRQIVVDMGGFDAEIQRFEHARAPHKERDAHERKDERR